MHANWRTSGGTRQMKVIHAGAIGVCFLAGALCVLLSFLAFAESQTISDWYTVDNHQGWTNPEAIASDGGACASKTPPDAGWHTVWMESTNDFSIPLTAIITGIEIRADAYSPDGGMFVPRFNDYLGNRILNSPITLATTETTYIFGGPEELFGQDWTPAGLNARVGCQIHAIGTGLTIFVDYVSVTVYYKDLAPISIPDPGLEAAIREKLSKPTGDLYREELEGMTGPLFADRRGISNLEGIQHCTGLDSELHLQGNNIADISQLSGLTGLTGLYLQGNEITDIGPLSGLTKLAHLGLYYNAITDLSPLSGLTALIDLRLSDNNIADVSPLSGLTGLRRLELDGNNVVDIGPLSGLTGLWNLFLYDNAITDIGPLSGLTGLQKLALHRNLITDISPLLGLSGSLSYANVMLNNLDITCPAGPARQVIQALLAAGCEVVWLPQNGFAPDDTPPTLVIPPEVTIECCEPCDPASTGLATATDNCDPAPAVTYSDAWSGGPNYTLIERTWTAIDASGNESSGLQQIWITAPNVVVQCVDPVWVTSLPAQVGVDFVIEKCAIKACLWTRCNQNTHIHFLSPEEPVIADGVTVNHQDVPLPSDAPEGTYALMGTYMWIDDPCAPFLVRRKGPAFLYGIDLTPPEDPEVTSLSHELGAWSNDPNVAIEVSGATDTVSGVDGFEVAWDQNPTWMPTHSKTHEESWSGDTFVATSDGNWHFHLATVDNAGNWTSTVHLGPFRIDTTPPVLAVPADITIECEVPWDPEYTGQATATDNCDPDPSITYTHGYTASSNVSELRRTWTATDCAGNATSAVQTIWISAPDVTVQGVDPIWVNELPAVVSVGFTIENCATSAWLATRCNEDWSVHFASLESPVVADGSTINTQVVDLPAEAPEGTYQLFWTMMHTPHPYGGLLLKPGPSFLYGIDLTPPELGSCPGDLTWYAAPGETTAAAFWNTPTVTDNLDPCPTLTGTASSGDALPLGATLVTYTATDAAGNTSSCDFLVTVLESVAPKGVVEEMTEEFEGSDYEPEEVAVIVNVASQAIADGAPAGTTSRVLNDLIEEDLSFDEFVELIEWYAELIDEGVPAGKAMNEVLGRGNSKK